MDQELDPNRPYWTETDRFPVGTRVRIHLSPEERALAGETDNAAKAYLDAPHLNDSPHPPGSDGRTGIVAPLTLRMVLAFVSLPGHTIYVRFDDPVAIEAPNHIGKDIKGLRVYGDIFAPTELEVLS